MANWCNNRLTVWGAVEDVEAFIKANGGIDPEEPTRWRPLALSASVPMPSQLEPAEADQWQQDNWSTDDFFEDEGSWEALPDGSGWQLKFTSKYVMPYEWFKHVGAMYKNLVLELVGLELGMGLYIVQRADHGVLSEIDETDKLPALAEYMEVWQEKRDEFTRKESFKAFTYDVFQRRYGRLFEELHDVGDDLELFEEEIAWAPGRSFEIPAPYQPLQYRQVMLTQVDEGKNVRKFYLLTLFADGMVGKHWGRIGAVGETQLVDGGAQEFDRVLKSKLRGGYAVVKDVQGLPEAARGAWSTMRVEAVDPHAPGTRMGGFPFAADTARYPWGDGSPLLFMGQVELPDGRLAKMYSNPDFGLIGFAGNYLDAYDESYTENPYFQRLPVPLERRDDTYEYVLIEGEPLPEGLYMESTSLKDVPLWSQHAYRYGDDVPDMPEWIYYADPPADMPEFLFQMPIYAPDSKFGGNVDAASGFDWKAVYYVFWDGKKHARPLWHIDWFVNPEGSTTVSVASEPQATSMQSSSTIPPQPQDVEVKKGFWQRLRGKF